MRERIYTKVKRNENTNFTVASSECVERDENMKEREVAYESIERRNRRSVEAAQKRKEVDCVKERMRWRRSGNNTGNEKSVFVNEKKRKRGRGRRLVCSRKRETYRERERDTNEIKNEKERNVEKTLNNKRGKQ